MAWALEKKEIIYIKILWFFVGTLEPLSSCLSFYLIKFLSDFDVSIVGGDDHGFKLSAKAFSSRIAVTAFGEL